MKGDSDNAASLADLEKLHRQIEEQAACSHWPDVEALIKERNAMLTRISEREREAALLAAKKSTDRLLQLAKTARLELAGELAKLQRGRKATDIYRANR